jgi:Ankyrin repeat
MQWLGVAEWQQPVVWRGDVQGKYGMAPLHYAVMQGREESWEDARYLPGAAMEIVQLLVDHGSDVNQQDKALHPAPCTLNPHPKPCTLHPAPYTLHPKPCTLNSAP